MFSFFKRNKISIRAVSIPDFGWPKMEESETLKLWVNPERTVALSLYFFQLPPDIPTIKDIGVLRDFHRQSLADTGGGIIETDVLSKGNLPLVRTIFKIPQDPTGVTYLASITIPLRNYSFVVKIQAVEAGMTGIRDALVANKLLGAGAIGVDDNGFTNWFADPYDPGFNKGIVMNRAEAAIYDSEFPDHPLSLARKYLAQIEREINWGKELEKAEPFEA